MLDVDTGRQWIDAFAGHFRSIELEVDLLSDAKYLLNHIVITGHDRPSLEKLIINQSDNSCFSRYISPGRVSINEGVIGTTDQGWHTIQISRLDRSNGCPHRWSLLYKVGLESIRIFLVF